MLTRRDNSTILPLQHTLQQSQPLADIDRLDIQVSLSSAMHNTAAKITPSSNKQKRMDGNATHLTLQRQNLTLACRPQINHIQIPRSPKRTPVVRLARDRRQQPRGAYVEEEALGGAVQGATEVEVFALHREAESYLGVSRRVLKGGGHFEGFDPVEVEGLWEVVLRVGSYLEVARVSFYVNGVGV